VWLVNGLYLVIDQKKYFTIHSEVGSCQEGFDVSCASHIKTLGITIFTTTSTTTTTTTANQQPTNSNQQQSTASNKQQQAATSSNNQQNK